MTGVKSLSAPALLSVHRRKLISDEIQICMDRVTMLIARLDQADGDCDLGSGLIGHSQKMTVAASATAEKKTVGQRS